MPVLENQHTRTRRFSAHAYNEIAVKYGALVTHSCCFRMQPSAATVHNRAEMETSTTIKGSKIYIILQKCIIRLVHLSEQHLCGNTSHYTARHQPHTTSNSVGSIQPRKTSRRLGQHAAVCANGLSVSQAPTCSPSRITAPEKQKRRERNKPSL